MTKTKVAAMFGAGLALATLDGYSDTITPALSDFDPGVSITYYADHTSGHLAAGDGFTIFDVGGYTGVIATPANWVLDSTAPLYNPWGTAPIGPDNPALPNLTFVYTGPAVHQEFGHTMYEFFVVGTVSTSLVVDDWTSRDHRITQVGGEWVLGTPHTDEILVPVAVPDGGTTLGLLGLALLGVGELRRRM